MIKDTNSSLALLKDASAHHLMSQQAASLSSTTSSVGDSSYSQDYATFMSFLDPQNGQKADPGLAIMYFALVLGNDMMNQTGSEISNQADQLEELSKISTDIANIKSTFEQANGQIPGSEQDIDLTKSFKDQLTALGVEIQGQSWLSGSEAATSIANQISALQNLVGAPGSGKGMSLAEIWSQAGVGQPMPSISMAYGANNHISIFELSPITRDQYGALVNLLQNNPDYSSTSWSYNESTQAMTIIPNLQPGGPSADDVDNFLRSFVQGPSGSDQSGYNALMAIFHTGQTPNGANLQTVLTSFDTMESSATTLSNTSQTQMQYDSSEFTQLTNFLHTIQQTLIQGMNSINSNMASS
jgi:hypothetical protein